MFIANPVGYTVDQFRAHVATLKWPNWRPKFVTIHNTYEPNLRQWTQGGTSGQQRVANLNHYYKGMGWHSGPHLFIAPDLIWQACDLEADGVSVSCWNHITLAVEMVGDFEVEPFDSGDGAKVRDLTVDALAVLHKALGIAPEPHVLGVSGLHAHRECIRDHHACPGKNVDVEDMRKRIAAAMSKL